MAEPTIISRNPAHPSEIVLEAARATDADAAAAAEAARTAAPDWADGVLARARGLQALAARLEVERDDVATLIAREVGKPIGEARAEVDRGVAIIRFYAQAAFDPVGEILPSTSGPGSRLEVRRRPVGTVLAITPWNFPLAIPLWKSAPALAWGNTVILKPSREAIAVAGWLADAAAATLPPGVFTVVRADPARTENLIASGGIDAVSFTGSVATGRRLVILAAEHGLPIQSEMGGQNAAVVLDDADLDAAATIITGAGMAFAGQKCTATRRVVAHARVRDALIERLTDRTLGLAVGDPLDDMTVVGPVISDDARDEIRAALDAAVGEGTARRLATAGSPEEGWFSAPTLLEVQDPYAPIAQEEVFGPAVSVLTARDDDDAVRIANATRFGLSAAVYGRDLDRAGRLASRLEAGLVRVNAPTTGVDFHAPFGGVGESSLGVREQGRASKELFTVTQTVTIVPA